MDKIKPNTYHIPVLLDQVIDALDIRPEGMYLDGTAGGGGHSYAIASRLSSGKLIALDQDPEAVAAASERLSALSPSVYEVVLSNFEEMAGVLAERGIPCVDGILLDIGVSSHQLDTPERGFSYHESMDAPLDMRMGGQGESAADIVNSWDAAALAEIFFRYGEEKYARLVAAAIVRERETAPVLSTARLADIIRDSVPAAYRRKGHPARKVFQALRIQVNDELGRLSRTLDTAFGCLAPGGRLAVITFHSLEDRIVKQRFAGFCTGCTCPPEFPVCVCGKKPAATFVHRKPVTADETELEANPRSRSAKLRSVSRL